MEVGGGGPSKMVLLGDPLKWLRWEPPKHDNKGGAKSNSENLRVDRFLDHGKEIPFGLEEGLPVVVRKDAPPPTKPTCSMYDFKPTQSERNIALVHRLTLKLEPDTFEEFCKILKKNGNASISEKLLTAYKSNSTQVSRRLKANNLCIS